jgi:hypothetical protein
LSGPAHAATQSFSYASQSPFVEDLGQLTLGDTYYINVSVAPDLQFTDTFNFNLAADALFGAAANQLVLSLGPTIIYEFDSFQMTLFHEYNGAGSLISGGLSYNGILPIGQYSLQISGETTGVGGGIYALAMSAMNVPIPPTLLLLASGLVGLLGVRRRAMGLSR